jgi:hypothetical protein
MGEREMICALFVWLISHQPAVLLSHNKPATNNQSTVVFSQNKLAPATSHQPNEQAAWFSVRGLPFYLAVPKLFWFLARL